MLIIVSLFCSGWKLLTSARKLKGKLFGNLIFFLLKKWCTYHLGHLTIIISGNMLTMWYWSKLAVVKFWFYWKHKPSFFSCFLQISCLFPSMWKANFLVVWSNMTWLQYKCNYEFYLKKISFMITFWWKHIWHLLWNTVILYSYSDPKVSNFQCSV